MFDTLSTGPILARVRGLTWVFNLDFGLRLLAHVSLMYDWTDCVSFTLGAGSR